MYSQEIARLIRTRLEFLPNAHDVRIHGASGRIVLVSPDLVQQTITAQRLPGMTEKMLEKVKFFSGQFHRIAAAKNLIAPEVDLDIAESVPVHFLGKSLRAAQH